MIAIQATYPTFPLDVRYSAVPVAHARRPAGFSDKHKCHRFTLTHDGGEELFDYWTAREPNILDVLHCVLVDYSTVADVFSDVWDRPLDAEDVEPLVIHLVEEYATPLRDAFATARALLNNARKLRWLLDEEHVAQIRDWLESEGY